MAQILVRNIDPEVVKTLKERARLHGHSLEQEVRNLLTEAARLPRTDRVAIAARIRATTPARKQTDSTKLLRDDRDRR